METPVMSGVGRRFEIHVVEDVVPAPPTADATAAQMAGDSSASRPPNEGASSMARDEAEPIAAPAIVPAESSMAAAAVAGNKPARFRIVNVKEEEEEEQLSADYIEEPMASSSVVPSDGLPVGADNVPARRFVVETVEDDSLVSDSRAAERATDLSVSENAPEDTERQGVAQISDKEPKELNMRMDSSHIDADDESDEAGAPARRTRFHVKDVNSGDEGTAAPRMRPRRFLIVDVGDDKPRAKAQSLMNPVRYKRGRFTVRDCVELPNASGPASVQQPTQLSAATPATQPPATQQPPPPSSSTSSSLSSGAPPSALGHSHAPSSFASPSLSNAAAPTQTGVAAPPVTGRAAPPAARKSLAAEGTGTPPGSPTQPATLMALDGSLGRGRADGDPRDLVALPPPAIAGDASSFDAAAGGHEQERSDGFALGVATRADMQGQQGQGQAQSSQPSNAHGVGTGGALAAGRPSAGSGAATAASLQQKIDVLVQQGVQQQKMLIRLLELLRRPQDDDAGGPKDHSRVLDTLDDLRRQVNALKLENESLRNENASLKRLASQSQA
eukprot:Opistho-2@293